jgi:ankyrin repeat protein
LNRQFVSGKTSGLPAFLVQQRLVMFDFYIRAQLQSHYTALMWASKGGHTATVRALIEAGADLNLQDEVSVGMAQ